jgi:hypothetical protein
VISGQGKESGCSAGPLVQYFKGTDRNWNSLYALQGIYLIIL